MPKLVDVLGPVAKLISHHRELMILSSAARKPSYTSDIAATLNSPAIHAQPVRFAEIAGK